MICPICKREFDEADPVARAPFCCDRCKLIDLGRWLRGVYQVPVSAAGETGEPDEPPSR